MGTNISIPEILLNARDLFYFRKVACTRYDMPTVIFYTKNNIFFPVEPYKKVTKSLKN
jgi:hypothetical protein